MNPNPPEPTVRAIDIGEIVSAMDKLGLSYFHLVAPNGQPTPEGQRLVDYFRYRAEILNGYVRSKLMRLAEARQLYEWAVANFAPTLPPSMNKQKGDKRQVAYLASLVNLIVESVAGAAGFNPNPLQLTTFTRRGLPLRTLSRRVDGALPGAVNPVVLWEIKEYYHTTSFGSRIADGVYETLLDGMELEEMREHEGVQCEHILAIDAYETWWDDGKAYLCRMVDMLHMGYVDEILFGREVVEVLPDLARQWMQRASQAAPFEPQIRGEQASALDDNDGASEEQGLLHR